ncbi:MAG: DapH/DapD/GlmU-related protein [Hyphomicrobiales bacterium]
MQHSFSVASFVARWSSSPFAHINEDAWRITTKAEAHIRAAIKELSGEFTINDEIAVHRTAEIERGAVIKAPAIIGQRCFVAAAAYLRGGTYLDNDCIVGPGSELKTSFMFKGAKLAHLNFVGDSILGQGVNVEAGAIIANYRNEFAIKSIRFRFEGHTIETGVEKFGALIGDDCRIGANAVIAPGAVLMPGTKVARLSLFDLYPVDDEPGSRF